MAAVARGQPLAAARSERYSVSRAASTGAEPALEPSSGVSAPPVLPGVGGAGGPRGVTTAGEELFAPGFGMREAPDGGAPYRRGAVRRPR